MTAARSIPPGARHWCGDCMGTGWLHDASGGYRCVCSMPEAPGYDCDACEDARATHCSECDATGWVRGRYAPLRCAACYERGPDYGLIWCGECRAAELDAGPGCRCDGGCVSCDSREQETREIRKRASSAGKAEWL